MKKTFRYKELPAGHGVNQTAIILAAGEETKAIVNCPKRGFYFGIKIEEAEDLLDANSEEQPVISEHSFDFLFEKIYNSEIIPSQEVNEFLEKNNV